MTLAFALHNKELRWLSYANATSISKDHYSETYHGTAESLVNDCIHRGLLEVEPLGGVSFGHFTYQEFLAAKYLSHRNPVEFIWKHIDSDWWRKALEFYAALKGDITPLVQIAAKYGADNKRFYRLFELIKLAPFTSERNIRKFAKLRRLPYKNLLRDISSVPRE